MKPFAFAAALTFAAGYVFADGTALVDNEVSVRLHTAVSMTKHTLTATNRVMAATRAQEATYPSSVGEPSFWLDCSDTSGWIISEDAEPTVSYIPSKAGSKLAGKRWLTTTPEGGDWKGWGDSQQVPMLPPYLRQNDAVLGGGKYLDFSANRRALSFNPAYLTATAMAKTNALIDIGTVITVWGSDVRNGGHFLGGGASKPYGWHRDANYVTAAGNASYIWSNRIMNGNAQPVAYYGWMWQDGILTAPGFSSYNGGWEVLSFRCSEYRDYVGLLAESNGIGINDKRPGMDWVSGGQQVAEVLIYDRRLTRAEMELVEMYLERKWFGRNRTGFNGVARDGVLEVANADFAGEINVPSGETLEIDRIVAGSARATKGTLDKTGSGTLVFRAEGASHYAAELIVREGTVSFPSERAIPKLGDLANHLYARFDASDLKSIDLVDSKYVSKWGNLVTTAEAKTYGASFMLRQNTASNRPWVLRDALGTGLNVIDFGPLRAGGGAFMEFSTNATAIANKSNPMNLHGVQTVVAVLGAQEGGGNLMNVSSFQRQNSDTRTHRNPVYYHGIAGTKDMNARDQVMWSEGRLWDGAKGYEKSGYQVVAFQTVGCSPTRLMYAANGAYTGGARIGEMLIWNRTLTEREILDAQAYLSAKWLKRATPGYARQSAEFAATDLQYLTVPAGAKIELFVDEGRTVRIHQLKAAGTLVKTGKGQVEIEKAEFLLEGHVVCNDDTLSVVGVRDVATSAEIAPGATMHLDATATATMNLLTRDGDKAQCVNTWEDTNGGVGLWHASGGSDLSRTPHLTTVANGCNGKSVVDFGKWGDSSALTNQAGCGTWMYMDRPLHSMRAIYAVIKYHITSNASGDTFVGFLFGNADGYNDNDGGSRISWFPWENQDVIYFHNGLTGGKWDGRLMNGYTEQSLFRNTTRVNGVSVDPWQWKPESEKFVLLEMHPTGGVQAGAMALDREITSRIGGFAIAELVVYERELSDREKVATRNALMRKWLDKSYSDPLPPVPEKDKLVYSHDLVVDGETTFRFNEDDEKVRALGEGTLVKTGDGSLVIKDISDFEGTISVRDGAVVVPYPLPYATPNLPANGIVYHADATRGIVATTNADSVVCVSEWANLGSAKLKAVRDGGEDWYQQLYYDPDVGYMPTVDMNGYNACMTWRKTDGSTTDIQTLSGIKSIFWMIGSQNGGGFMMGGGTNGSAQLSHMWHRGIYYPNWPATTGAMVGTTNICEVLNPNMQGNAYNANWWKNGEKMAKGGYLSGKWDQLSMIVTADGLSVNASGFAFDGRSRLPDASKRTNHEYNGHQRLAEVVCSNRRVSETERRQIECYLRCKWHNNMRADAPNVTIDVSGGAVFDFGVNTQTVAGVSGSGTLKCGQITAGALYADANALNPLTVTGTFIIPEGIKVYITNASNWPAEGIPLIKAGTFVNIENLATAVFLGVPEDAEIRLTLRDGVIYAKRSRGGLIIVR